MTPGFDVEAAKVLVGRVRLGLVDARHSLQRDRHSELRSHTESFVIAGDKMADTIVAALAEIERLTEENATLRDELAHSSLVVPTLEARIEKMRRVVEAARVHVPCLPCGDPDCCDMAIREDATRRALKYALSALTPEASDE